MACKCVFSLHAYAVSEQKDPAKSYLGNMITLIQNLQVASDLTVPIFSSNYKNNH